MQSETHFSCAKEIPRLAAKELVVERTREMATRNRVVHPIWLTVGLFTVSLLSIVPTAAQTYPSKPIRLVVPFGPGGGSDFLARLVGQKLGEQLGQQFIVDNRPGAGSVLGTDLVAKSVPNGYTLLLGHVGAFANSPHLTKVPYNPVRDFTAASLIASSSHMLVVHPSLPVRSVKELIALAKSRPGEINYASGGTGNPPHLVAELFRSVAGINIVHIPYKSGGLQVLALLSGEAQMSFSNANASLAHIRAGRLVALAVTSSSRSPLLPEVPTMVESGLRDVEVGTWYALVAPAATPRAITARLHDEMVKLTGNPDYRQQLERQGLEPLISDPEQFSAFVQTELDKWGKVIRAAGIKME